MIHAPPPADSRKTSGFASPAQGYEETAIDLNTLLVKNPAATYLFRLKSDELAPLGVPKGATLIVDRSQPALLHRLAVIQHEGEFLCRLLTEENGKPLFTNGMTNIIPVPNETQIIGTVTAYIVDCTV
jgi:DNA polymerase V